MLCADEVLRHGVKVGPRPQNPGHRDPQTQDLGHPQSLKVGPQNPTPFKV